jgi:hypothetical protein
MPPQQSNLAVPSGNSRGETNHSFLLTSNAFYWNSQAVFPFPHPISYL